MGIGARDVFGWDPDSFFVITPHDADQTSVVGGEIVGAPIQTIQQSSKRRVSETLVCKAS
jgi:hypothetical protein